MAGRPLAGLVRLWQRRGGSQRDCTSGFLEVPGNRSDLSLADVFYNLTCSHSDTLLLPAALGGWVPLAIPASVLLVVPRGCWVLTLLLQVDHLSSWLLISLLLNTARSLRGTESKDQGGHYFP